MDKTQLGTIAILKAAITGVAETLPEGFDIAAVYQLIKHHHVAPLIYEGAIACGISPDEQVMQQLFQTYCRMLLKSELQMRDVQRIYAAFDENHIDYLPLKGCRMKALYPKPALRGMGDADLLIRMEQYELIRPIMEKLGFREKGESVHELVWESDALYLELHKHLIPAYNKDLYEYFGTGWQRAIPEKDNYHIMSVEDEWIFLFTHFAKHFRDGGIGCRHIVDLWVYLRSYPKMDETYVRNGIAQLQLTEFYDNILRLIDCWFETAAGDEKTDLISRIIFDSGCFGRMETHLLSLAVREADRGKKMRNGRLAYLRKLLFPNVQMLEGKYRVLKKAPWLLPLVWIYRPFYKLLVEGASVKKQKKELDVLTEDNVDTRRQLLRYLGIDYRF